MRPPGQSAFNSVEANSSIGHIALRINRKMHRFSLDTLLTYRARARAQRQVSNAGDTVRVAERYKGRATASVLICAQILKALIGRGRLEAARRSRR
jgi:hypothetical protein